MGSGKDGCICNGAEQKDEGWVCMCVCKRRRERERMRRNRRGRDT